MKTDVMTAKEIIAFRLFNQFINSSPAKTAREAVSQLCAMQGQDYAGTKWSIGLRVPGLTDAAVDDALAAKEIIRISSLRGTIHFIAPEDVRWIGRLIQPRIVSAFASVFKSYGLDETQIRKSHDVIRKTLEGGKQLSRDELKAALEKKKIDTSGHRMNSFISRAGTDLVICCAPRRGKEFTYALLDEWLPADKKAKEEETLSTLALRYLTGHGPATVQDFSYWCGETLSAAKAAILALGKDVEKITAGGREYWMKPATTTPPPATGMLLLPGFDEYYTGYADRSLLASEDELKKLTPPNGILQPIVVNNGKITGNWKRTVKKHALELDASPFTTFSDAQKKALIKRSKDFSRFMGLPVEWI